MLRLFYALLFLTVIVMLWFFLTGSYRQWKKSKDFRKAIERPKYDYLEMELGRDWRNESKKRPHTRSPAHTRGTSKRRKGRDA